MEINDYQYLPYKEILSPMEIIELSIFDICYDNTVYLFTWNPKPVFYQYDKLGNNDYISQWLKMLSVLKGFSRVSKHFVIVPEISDEGKLHVHGWFSLDDRVKWLKSVKKSICVNGFMKINKLHTQIEKIDYYYKDIDITRDVLGDMFQVVTELTLSDCLSEARRYVLSKAPKKRRNKVFLEKWFGYVADSEDEDEELYLVEV